MPESAESTFVPEPALPDDVAASDLDAEVRRDLRGLQKDTAESVARHLVAAGTLVDEDPELALQHARYARRRASRIAVVREAAGIAAYHAGEWSEALGELRAARRMGGGPGHIAVMADIERALGRPERALELARGPEVAELGSAEQIELAIVAAGARRDLGELDAAVVGLQIPALDPSRRDPWSGRLFYAYADNLLAAGRESDALEWFVHTADADTEGETDVAVRIAELTGEPVPEDDVVFGEEELTDDAAAAGAEASGDTVASDAGHAEVAGDPAEAGAAEAVEPGAAQTDGPADDASHDDTHSAAAGTDEDITSPAGDAPRDVTGCAVGEADEDVTGSVGAGADEDGIGSADARSDQGGTGTGTADAGTDEDRTGAADAAETGQAGEDVAGPTGAAVAGDDVVSPAASADGGDVSTATDAGSSDRDGSGS
ncbi:hypothetical protein [Pseudonocardia sp. H11422]|uniref:hypothetical protein n=1 Tax=Pseudonocardia sp. H11422 TaxID=2835866 RepID=UPI001BDCFDCF|nr:hypothetical protein [Pseudonocardia sp. H11422]